MARKKEKRKAVLDTFAASQKYPQRSVRGLIILSKKLFHRQGNMCILHHQKYKERRNEKINKCRDYLPIQYTLKRKIFHLFDLESGKDRIENHRSDKIFYHSFYKLSHLGSDKQSNSDTDDIVLREKTKKFFEHDYSTYKIKQPQYYKFMIMMQESFFVNAIFCRKKSLKTQENYIHWEC